MRLQYPFLKTDGAPYSSKELFDILFQENSGHYLLGSYDFWHGGVHFTDQVLPELKNTPVRAIADGAVVAYRINKHYPVADVDNPVKKRCEYYRYSTSFCLVKHEYEGEVEKAPILHTPVAPATPQGWAGKTIVFERNVIARNPNVKTDQDAGYKLKVEVPSGSKAKVVEVDNDGYMTVEMTYFSQKIKPRPVNSRSGEHRGRSGRDGVGVTVLPNKKPNFKLEDEVLIQGEDVYFKAFEDNIMLGAGRGLFTEDVATSAASATSPTASTSDTIGVPSNSSNKLTFYSLYMHLLPFEAYEGKTFVKVIVKGLDEREKPSDNSVLISSNSPPEKDKTIYEVVGQKNSGGFIFLLGYRVNAAGERISDIPVWFKEGSKQIEGKNTPYVATHRIANIIAKKEAPAYWLEDAKIEATVLEDERQIFTYVIKSDEPTFCLKYSVQLMAGSVFTYDPLTDKQTEEITLIEQTTGGVGKETKSVTYMKCQLVKGVSSGSIAQTFYLLWDEDIQKRLSLRGTPKQFDKVVNCETPIPVQAGGVLGYLGRYETPIDRDGGLNDKHQLHFEIFSNDPPAQIKRFLNNDAKIKTGRRYVRVDKGAEVIFAETPPVAKDLPNTLVENRLRLSQFWVRSMTEMAMSKDDQNQVWLGSKEFDNVANKKGWVKENGIGVEMLTQHDLAKLGFTPIEEENRQATGYNETGELWEGSNEVSDFFNNVCKNLDTNDDGRIAPDEIRQALDKPQVAEQVRKIISYHPSEWKHNAKLVEVLETVARKYEELNRNLLHAEIDKLTSLVFWDDVSELKGHDRAHFFHPITFIQYLGPNVEKPIKIAIDAGHGGYGLTSGKRTGNLPVVEKRWNFGNLRGDTLDQALWVPEWEFNDVVATAIMEELNAYQNVETKRFDDETGREIDIAVGHRKKAADDWGAKCYISCHHNAVGKRRDGSEVKDGEWSNTGDYVTVMIHTNKNANSVSKQLALNIVKKVSTAMRISRFGSNEGVYATSDYYMINQFKGTNAQGEERELILIEGGFMNSMLNIQKMLDDNYKLRLQALREQGQGIALGIAEELKLVKK